MAQPLPQTRTTSARAAISGISLLMLVAVAVQASAGLLTPAVQARVGLPMVRLIAEAVTRRVERQVRRQEERPVICRAVVLTALKPESISVAGLGAAGVGARRLLVLLTNLPPPGNAVA